MLSITMPVGRFREDPRTLGDREREIYARQYPEGLLVVGTLLGVGLRLGFSTGVVSAPTVMIGHVLSIAGVLVGGVAGYLLGVAYRDRKLRAVREAGAGGESVAAAEGGASPGRTSAPAEPESPKGE